MSGGLASHRYRVPALDSYRYHIEDDRLVPLASLDFFVSVFYQEKIESLAGEAKAELEEYVLK